MDKSPADRWIAAALAGALVGGAALYFTKTGGSPIEAAYAAEGVTIPAPAAKIAEPAGEQVALFAGGCFWGVEGVFEHVEGVRSAESGYAGGLKDNAGYDAVSNGETGHAEAVRVTYDPAKVSYDTLLHIFFSVAHDPTQLNRQGPDTGKHYRSALFPANDAQREAAVAYIVQLGQAKVWPARIVTQIEGGTFYPAEEYHQDYMVKNPNSGYIRNFDVPKVQELKRLFPGLYR